MAEALPARVLETQRLLLRPPEESLADALTGYLRRNRAHFAASGPRMEGEPTVESSLAALRAARRELDSGAGARFYLFLREGPAERIIGNVSFSNIVRGIFLACHLGYRLDQEYEGRGLMHEALTRAMRYAFEDLGLHRVMANYVPTNERSGRVLRRLGFVVEGYARDYLFLNGEWKDHILTSLVRPVAGAAASP